MTMNIDLNVEAMSRQDLIAAYFDLVDRLEAIFCVNNEGLNSVVAFVKHHETNKKYSSLGCAKTLCLLLSGRLVSRESIVAATATNKAPEDCVTVSGGMASVYICNLRKILKPLRIEIITSRGLGYYLNPSHITPLKQAIEQASAPQGHFQEGAA
ncbi:MAG: helix-turn-helix domain-containing protein [Robiginitomaculum sp.]|nr:helix-turn-helix domain-containing protein [Robiginitomaculum sp.]